MEELEETTPPDTENEISESEIDENIEESFPASDPPSWTLGHEPHSAIDSNENDD